MSTSMGESREGGGEDRRDDQKFLGAFLATLISDEGASPERILLRSIDGYRYAMQYWHYGDKHPETKDIFVDYGALTTRLTFERSPETREEE